MVVFEVAVLASDETAHMVQDMTNEPSSSPVGPTTTCCACPHLVDDHVMALVVDLPNLPAMGLMFCPEGCACGSTWRAGTGRSTANEIQETRRLVREGLVSAGVPVPAFLR